MSANAFYYVIMVNESCILWTVIKKFLTHTQCYPNLNDAIIIYFSLDFHQQKSLSHYWRTSLCFLTWHQPGLPWWQCNDSVSFPDITLLALLCPPVTWLSCPWCPWCPCAPAHWAWWHCLCARVMVCWLRWAGEHWQSAGCSLAQPGKLGQLGPH